jgi:starch synthase (maltosyl-transferring)
VSDFFRPNFWPNTPDILPEHLQHVGRGAFSVRLLLAATLSSNYGIYGPAFELMDNRPRATPSGYAEEYADNEKYELKAWNLSSADSLRPLVARINTIRRQNAALHSQRGLSFHPTGNDMLLCYARCSADGSNALLVVVNLDAHHAQEGWVQLDTDKLDLELGSGVQLHDLLSDARYLCHGKKVFVRLDPALAPGHVFRIRRRLRTEHEFDYFE